MGLANISPVGSAEATEKSSRTQETAKGGMQLRPWHILITDFGNLVTRILGHEVGLKDRCRTEVGPFEPSWARRAHGWGGVGGEGWDGDSAALQAAPPQNKANRN